jgi:hypothetical protein
LLPKVLTWLLALGRTNYFNSFSLTLLHYNYWLEHNHPAREVLIRDFKAFSEERGEISIHELLTHLRDWNFLGSRLDLFYRETRASHIAFDRLKVDSRSHKDSSVKRFDLDHLSRYLQLAHAAMNDIQQMTIDGQLVPFAISSSQVTLESQCTANPEYWAKLWRKFVRRDFSASKKFLELERVLKEPLSHLNTPETGEAVEMHEEYLYW